MRGGRLGFNLKAIGGSIGMCWKLRKFAKKSISISLN